jgi:probable F420-dependent oxidoreductase
LQDAARRIEALELDFITEGDHLGGPDPFSLLTAAAAVTERVRLRTYVLNVGFWVPALLAREAATVDVLSDGRLELGVGAGTVRAEFDEAGVPWRRPSERIGQMAEALLDVRGRLADEGHVPRPVQRPIPILVGAMSRAGLRVAAEQADIVGFSGLRHARGQPPGTLTAASADETDEFVALVREQAGGRRFESDVLLQTVELGLDPLAAARRAVKRDYEGIDPIVLAESPCALFARSAAEAAAELERRRERWGFTSFTTFWPSAEAIAQVRRELA